MIDGEVPWKLVSRAIESTEMSDEIKLAPKMSEYRLETCRVEPPVPIAPDSRASPPKECPSATVTVAPPDVIARRACLGRGFLA
jgi:hypothetical protein